MGNSQEKWFPPRNSHVNPKGPHKHYGAFERRLYVFHVSLEEHRLPKSQEASKQGHRQRFIDELSLGCC